MNFSFKALSKYLFQGGIFFIIVSALTSAIYYFCVYSDPLNHYYQISIGFARRAYIVLLSAGIFAIISAIAFIVAFICSICDLASFTISASIITGLISVIGLITCEGLYLRFSKYETYLAYPPDYDFCDRSSFSDHTKNLRKIPNYKVNCCNISDMSNEKCYDQNYEIYPFPSSNEQQLINKRNSIKQKEQSDLNLFKDWVNYFFFSSEYKISFTILNKDKNEYEVGYVPPCYPTACKDDDLLSCAQNFNDHFVDPYYKQEYDQMNKISCRALNKCFHCLGSFKPSKELEFQTKQYISTVKKASVNETDPIKKFQKNYENYEHSNSLFVDNNAYRVVGLSIPFHVIPAVGIVVSVIIQVWDECRSRPADPEEVQ